MGSVATRDYVRGFSDTETLLVIRRETATDAARLLRLRGLVERSMRSLYRIDPFQHHGHFVISEMDFDYYPQAFVPLVYFRGASAFLGGGAFRVRERDSHLERRRALRAVAPMLVHGPEDLYDVRRNLAVTARHLRELLATGGGDLRVALNMYHTGPRGRHLPIRGDDRYVGLICTYYASLKVRRRFGSMVAMAAETTGSRDE